jgi:hypothetical protein
MSERFNPEQTFATPGKDWIPLDRAAFYYGENFIRSAEDWRLMLEDVLSSRKGFTVEVDEGGSSVGADRGRVATIRGGGLLLELLAQSGVMYLAGPVSPGEIFPELCFWGSPDEFCRQLAEAKVAPEYAEGFRLHLDLVHQLCATMRMNLSGALGSGAARLMARKRSPLEPFSFVPIDQWHHFTPDRPIADDESLKPWFSPIFYKKAADEVIDRCTATGPAGEKLFSVHVAPGELIRSDAAADLEKKCTQWLANQLRQFQESYPGGIRAAMTKAQELFPGLAERAFQRSYSKACEQTGNKNWSKPGRPPNSLRLISSSD